MSFERELQSAAYGGRVLKDEPMKNHTTFRVGGPADWYVAPADEASLREVVRLCRRENVPYFILGNGSNLLVSDGGYRGVIIHSGVNLSGMEVREETDGVVIEAGSGALLASIARRALKESLTGFEFAAGIPGTLGGALVMNAGAYGGEMKQVVRSARVFTRDGRTERIAAADLDLSYRHSSIPKNQWIVLSAEIVLREGDPETIRETMDDLNGRRREKQPVEFSSAGSTFKRPEGYFAGKLIQDAGLRGFTVGGAQVSEKHCGFVINRGDATAEDVLAVIRGVQKRVYEDAGVQLEPEVMMLGFDR